VKITGRVSMYLIRDGVKETIEVPNQVVSFGLNWIAARMLSSPPGAVITHAGVGASNAATTQNMVNLVSPIGSRKPLTGSTRTGNKLTFSASFNQNEGTGAIQESGLFHDIGGATLCARTTFPTVNKGANDTYGFDWEITIGADGG
jgi:hypothetical protein